VLKKVTKGLVVAAFAFAAIASPFATHKADAASLISSCSDAQPVYQRGDKGFCVTVIQEMLNRTRVKYGQTKNPSWPVMTTPYDGIYGSKTEQAVIAFQFVHRARNSSIMVDGKVGQQTWFLFYVECQSMSPKPFLCQSI
jgi:hypothetical protein